METLTTPVAEVGIEDPLRTPLMFIEFRGRCLLLNILGKALHKRQGTTDHFTRVASVI